MKKIVLEEGDHVQAIWPWAVGPNSGVTLMVCGRDGTWRVEGIAAKDIGPDGLLLFRTALEAYIAFKSVVLRESVRRKVRDSDAYKSKKANEKFDPRDVAILGGDPSL